MIRLAHIVSHPIQYFAHRYRAIARRPDVEFRVFFGSRMGLESYFDREFGQTFSWNMPLLEGYASAFPGGSKPATASAIERALDAFDPAAVWLHGYGDLWTRAGWQWARRQRRMLFLSGDTNIRKERRKPLWKRWIKPLVLRPFFRSFTGFLTVGEANEAFYRTCGVPASRFIRFPFTVDPLLFDAAAADRPTERRRRREQWGLPLDACVALWCGKITALKRPMDFVEALGQLRAEEGPPVWGLFAGEGALREMVEKRCAALGVQARFSGFLNVDDVAGAYAAADWLVHTCDAESYGLVAVEAARMGLPMIVPASMGAVGMTDAARPGVNAWVFEDGDQEGLVRHMRRMATNGAERAAMGVASRRIYDELSAAFERGVEQLVRTASGEGVP